MRKTLLVDANLLVLLTVGYADTKYIRRHKRLYPTYREEHFELLLDLLARASALATTTHALTEASNLLRQCAEPMRSDVMLALRILIGRLGEFAPEARQASALPEFVRLGLTDAAFATHEPGEFRLISADLDLIVALQNRGMEVVNFHHLLFD